MKVPSVKCHGNPCSRSGADTCGQTDGHDKQIGAFRPWYISSCARFMCCQTFQCRPAQVILLRINSGIKYERTHSLNITVTKFYRAVSHTKTVALWNVTPFSVAVSCQKTVVLIYSQPWRSVRLLFSCTYNQNALICMTLWRFAFVCWHKNYL